MQKQRFELKYLISNETALRLREFVHRGYLDLDENSVGRENFSYPVHSLYLDSDDLKTYWATINGEKNRFKLRLRFYSDSPEAPVFFELKRRMNNIIRKERGGVRQPAVPLLLAGHYPQPDQLFSKNPNQLAAIQNFCQLATRLRARPRVHITYLREAYVSDDDTVRVTMDREVRAEAHLEPKVRTRMTAPLPSFAPDVILELKFTNRFPTWFGELVRAFNVMQCGAAKYVESIGKIGAGPLHATTVVVEEPTLLARSW